MAINKVEFGGQTLIDLTADTVTPSTLMAGETAHDRSGAAIVGTATGGSSTLAQLTDVDLTDLSDEQIIKYNSTTQKWENADAGGSDIVHLTKAEYDALPDTKLSDNKMYMLEDVPAPGETLIYPICYHTLEREVGCWIDGKPIYQKTFHFNSTIYLNGNAWTNDINVDTTNVETLVDSEVLRTVGAHSYYGYLQVVPSNNNLLNIFNCRNLNMEIDTITLRYTKTTDVAGSGSYAPTGVPTHHYGTDEQVIGTWYDGSTIYEKTFILGTSWNFTANTWAKSEINKGNMNIIIDGTIYVFYGGSPSCHKVQLGWIDNKLAGNCYRTFEADVGSVVTLQYTKSS